MRPRKVGRVGYRIAAAMTLIVTAVIFAGCDSGGPERTTITGCVTYRGEPIPEGSITFVAEDNAKKTSMSAAIEEGEYQLDALGGLPTGNYRVKIVATRELSESEKKSRIAAGMSGPALSPQQYIPKKYNIESELKIAVEPGSRSLTHDFELTD